MNFLEFNFNQEVLDVIPTDVLNDVVRSSRSGSGNTTKQKLVDALLSEDRSKRIRAIMSILIASYNDNNNKCDKLNYAINRLYNCYVRSYFDYDNYFIVEIHKEVIYKSTIPVDKYMFRHEILTDFLSFQSENLELFDTFKLGYKMSFFID